MKTRSVSWYAGTSGYVMVQASRQDRQRIRRLTTIYTQRVNEAVYYGVMRDSLMYPWLSMADGGF